MLSEMCSPDKTEYASTFCLQWPSVHSCEAGNFNMYKTLKKITLFYEVSPYHSLASIVLQRANRISPPVSQKRDAAHALAAVSRVLTSWATCTFLFVEKQAEPQIWQSHNQNLTADFQNTSHQRTKIQPSIDGISLLFQNAYLHC